MAATVVMSTLMVLVSESGDDFLSLWQQAGAINDPSSDKHSLNISDVIAEGNFRSSKVDSWAAEDFDTIILAGYNTYGDVLWESEFNASGTTYDMTSWLDRNRLVSTSSTLTAEQQNTVFSSDNYRLRMDSTTSSGRSWFAISVHDMTYQPLPLFFAARSTNQSFIYPPLMEGRLGCWQNSQLTDWTFGYSSGTDNAPSLCITQCSTGFNTAVLVAASECYCANHNPATPPTDMASFCYRPCPGDGTVTCGGFGTTDGDAYYVQSGVPGLVTEELIYERLTGLRSSIENYSKTSEVRSARDHEKVYELTFDINDIHGSADEIAHVTAISTFTFVTTSHNYSVYYSPDECSSSPEFKSYGDPPYEFSLSSSNETLDIIPFRCIDFRFTGWVLDVTIRLYGVPVTSEHIQVPAVAVIGKKIIPDASKTQCTAAMVEDIDKETNANCKMVKRTGSNGQPQLCLFAIKCIKSGSELRYDYGVASAPWSKQQYTELHEQIKPRQDKETLMSVVVSDQFEKVDTELHEQIKPRQDKETLSGGVSDQCGKVDTELHEQMTPRQDKETLSVVVSDQCGIVDSELHEQIKPRQDKETLSVVVSDQCEKDSELHEQMTPRQDKETLSVVVSDQCGIVDSELHEQIKPRQDKETLSVVVSDQCGIVDSELHEQMKPRQDKETLSVVVSDQCGIVDTELHEQIKPRQDKETLSGGVSDQCGKGSRKIQRLSENQTRLLKSLFHTNILLRRELRCEECQRVIATTSSSTAATTTTTAAPTTSTAAPTTSTAAPTTSTAAPTTSTAAPTTSTAAPTTSTAAPTTSTAAPTTSTAARTTTSAPPTTTTVTSFSSTSSTTQTSITTTPSSTTTPKPTTSTSMTSVTTSSTAVTTTTTSAPTTSEGTTVNTSSSSGTSGQTTEVTSAGQTTTTVSQSTTTKATCYCPCGEVNTQENLTDAQLEAKIESIQKKLAVNVSELSSTIRKLTSAEDSRPSAVGIGYVGIGFLVAMFGSILFIDSGMILKDLKQLYRNLKEGCQGSS